MYCRKFYDYTIWNKINMVLIVKAVLEHARVTKTDFL